MPTHDEVMSAIRASTSSTEAAIAAIKAEGEQHRAAFEARFAAQKAELDAVSEELAVERRSRHFGISASSSDESVNDMPRPGESAYAWHARARRGNTPAAKEERESLNGFARQHGDAPLNSFGPKAETTGFGFRAAMTTGSNPDGGFSVVPELETGIRLIQRDVSPLRQLCDVKVIKTASYKILSDSSEVSAGWVAETDARTATNGIKLNEHEVPIGEMYAMPAATQDLLDDSSVDLGAWLEMQAGLKFSRMEAAAFATGDGVKKPRGILALTPESADDFNRTQIDIPQYLPVGSTSPTDDQLSDGLINLVGSLRAPYRQNAAFIMSRSMLSQVRSCKDANGNLLWSSDGRMVAPTPDRLLGYPVFVDENAPVAAGNAFPIWFGDFSQGYVIVDRQGLRLTRDPYTNKPYVLFYMVKRVGGQIIDGNAIKLLKWSVS